MTRAKTPSDLPNLMDLAALVELGNAGSLTKAAVVLASKTSTLNMAMKRLTAQLGCGPLYVRTKGGIELTKMGQLVARQAKSLLALWHESEDLFADAESSPKGAFTLCCHPTAGSLVLPPVFANLRQQFPGITLTVATEFSKTIVQQVESLEIDFGLSTATVRHENVRSRLVLKTNLSLYGHPSVLNKLSKKDPTPIYADPQVKGFAELQRKLQAEPTLRLVPVRSLDIVQSLALAKAGVSFLPDKVVERLPAGAKLVRHLSRFSVPVKLHLIWRKEAERFAAVQAIIGAFFKADQDNRSS